MNNVPNIRHLRSFLAVAQCKSISKATDVVFLSQPAITQAIVKLESMLETCLFDRKSDGMYVTESGQIFANRVERFIALIHDGVRDAVRIGNGKSTAHPSSLANLVTTTQLKALIAVAVAQSFSVAGRNLGISQSTLHRSARDLESLLGVPLFEKTSIGISPSKAALSLMKSTKLAFAEIEQGREEVNSYHNREIGHMVVGSMPLARTSVLPQAIIDFTEEYPDFQISINDGPYDDLLFHLRHGDIDMLIGALRIPLPADDVVQDELFSSGVVIVVRPEHPLLSDQDLTLDKLAKGSWVVPRKGTPTRSIFENLFRESGVDAPERLVESSSQILIRSILAGSDRMTVISEHQVQYELDAGILAVLPYSLEDAHRPIGITTRKGWQPTATQKHFMEIVRAKSRYLDGG